MRDCPCTFLYDSFSLGQNSFLIDMFLILSSVVLIRSDSRFLTVLIAKMNVVCGRGGGSIVGAKS